MGDLDFAFQLGQRVAELERRVGDHDVARLTHEADAGAHAAAFSAHGLSPGPVEDAEDTAEAIIDSAVNTVEEVTAAPVEVATETTSDAGSAPDTVADAVEAVQEAAEEAIEDIAAAVPAGGGTDDERGEEPGEGEVTDEGPLEREPRREHALHKRWW